MGGSGGSNLCGSRFMDENNGRVTVLSLHALKQLQVENPHAIYWSYIRARAQYSKHSASSVEDLALARLVCLSRAQSAEDLTHVTRSWRELEVADRKTLTEHFVADGIRQRALLFSFLPLCIVNSMANQVAGLKNTLVLVAELIQKLDARGCWGAHAASLTVDLFDLASYIERVKNSSNFCTCLDRAELRQTDNKVQVMMTHANWDHVNDIQGPEPSASRMLQRILRNQHHLQEAFGRSHDQAHSKLWEQESEDDIW